MKHQIPILISTQVSTFNLCIVGNMHNDKQGEVREKIRLCV